MVRATRDFSWLTGRTGVEFTPAARGMVQTRDEKIAGMVACDLWGGTSAQVHVAATSAAGCRTLAREFFGWAFGEAKREVLIAIVASSNKPCLRLIQFFGFQGKHVICDGFQIGVDFVLFEMRRADCKWLPAEVAK